MTGSVIVGVLIALMFLVSFSEWFYHIVASINVEVIQDIYVVYRTMGWVIGGVAFMMGFFWLLAITQECPKKGPKEGIFAYLQCEGYLNFREMLIERGIMQPTTEEILDPNQGPGL